MSRGLQRNRKLATLVVPTGYDAVDVELGEVVGHLQPVDAVLRARLAIGGPGQAAAVLFDGVEEATEERGEVLLHGDHCTIGVGGCQGVGPFFLRT